MEDHDMPAPVEASGTLKSSDLDGRYDGAMLNETSPLDGDSDDDGLADGTEDSNHDGLWDWNNQIFTGETCAWRFDSDTDGLGDGMEVGKALWNITTYTNTSIFVPDADTSTTTNPLAIDSDGDGVPDGWIDGWTMNSDGQLGRFSIPDYEFQFGEGEDRNLNGKFDGGETDPNSLDSDKDHLADGWDIVTSASYSNLFYTTEGGAKRYWGELNFSTHKLGTRDGNDVYQSGPTDPTNIDSDGDGLADGGNVTLLVNSAMNATYAGQGIYGWRSDETHYTYLGEGANGTDPWSPDTDHDGLWDGPSPTATIPYTGWMRLGSVRFYVMGGKPYGAYRNIELAGFNVRTYGELSFGCDPMNDDTDNNGLTDGEELLSYSPTTF